MPCNKKNNLMSKLLNQIKKRLKLKGTWPKKERTSIHLNVKQSSICKRAQNSNQVLPLWKTNFRKNARKFKPKSKKQIKKSLYSLKTISKNYQEPVICTLKKRLFSMRNLPYKSSLLNKPMLPKFKILTLNQKLNKSSLRNSTQIKFNKQKNKKSLC